LSPSWVEKRNDKPTERSVNGKKSFDGAQLVAPSNPLSCNLYELCCNLGRYFWGLTLCFAGGVHFYSMNKSAFMAGQTAL
jgi:hypothetical protein